MHALLDFNSLDSRNMVDLDIDLYLAFDFQMFKDIHTNLMKNLMIMV
jgi:hypothetical protein